MALASWPPGSFGELLSAHSLDRDPDLGRDPVRHGVRGRMRYALAATPTFTAWVMWELYRCARRGHAQTQPEAAAEYFWSEGPVIVGLLSVASILGDIACWSRQWVKARRN